MICNNPFTQEQLSTLHDLIQIIGAHHFVLIGAKALACYYDLQWRETNDLDLTVAIGQEHQKELFDKASWGKIFDYRWQSPQGIMVDMLAVGELPLQKSYLAFKKNEHKMNITGFELAFENWNTFTHDLVTIKVAATPWNEMVKQATGAYLSPEAFAQDFVH